MQLGSFTASSFIYLLTLDSAGVLPTFALDYDPFFTKHLRSLFFHRPLHTLILHTTVDSAHDSVHGHRFFTHPLTHELDRPLYRQAASTL